MNKAISKTIVCATCGHPNNISCSEGQSTYQCECCERIHSIPKDEEKYSTLYDRATSLRLNNCFDQAIDTYNMILDQDDTNEEAHFWIAMCRYGVNYVKDEDGIYHPTCWYYHEKPILADYDYRRALSLSSPINAEIYRAKAEEIHRIQRKIGRIIQTEKAYDAFICFKETDDTTRRKTPDSDKAEELYEALTDKGYRVFYAPRTFQSVLVEEYEPYIYAALYSAKTMYIVSSSREYAESKWVKNEWQRFIEFKKNNPEKVLRVLLLGMSPDDLPAELVNYQAYDLSRLGVFEKLCIELDAITQHKTDIEPQRHQPDHPSNPVDISHAALERGYNFLNTEEFDGAYEYFNKALNTNAKLPDAYWGLLLAEHQCRDNDALIALGVCIDNESNYRFALQYADNSARKEYQHIAQMTLCMEQVYIMAQICNNDMYRASLRAENYCSSGLCDKNIFEIYKSLDKNADFSEINAMTAKMLESLLKSFTTDACFIELDNKFNLMDAINSVYLDRLFEQILAYGEQGKNVPEQSLELLASIKDLASIWTQNDGERCLTLVENLKNQSIYTDDVPTLEWTKFAFDCYDQAAALGADQNKCLTAKQDFFELVLKKADSADRLIFLSEEYPNDWRVYWKFVQPIMKDYDPEEDLSPNQMPYIIKGLNMSVETYFENPETSSKVMEEAINNQEERIRYCEKIPEQLQTKAGRYLEQAFACAGEKQTELQNEWNTYIQGVNACCDRKLQLFRTDLEQVKNIALDCQTQYLKHENKLDKSAKRNGITCSILSLLLLILPACIVFYAWQNMRNPERLSPYPILGYTTAAVVLSFIGGAISGRVQLYLRKLANNKRNNKEITKKIPLIAAILTGIVTAGSISLFIYTAVRFNTANDWKTADAKANGPTAAPTLVTVNPVSVMDAEASSELTVNKYTYFIAYSYDGDVNTSWQDGVPRNGSGEVLTYYFDQPRYIVGVDIINGRVDIEKNYYDNNRIERLVVYYVLDGVVRSNAVVDLDDVYNMEPVYYELTDGVFNEAYYCDSIQIEIESVYEGEKFNDLCLTEIQFYEGIYE